MAANRTTADPGSKGPPIGLWALVLGGAGFAAGFFGPMLLQPEANQGPMVGLFITGPGGAVLGLVLGVLLRFLPLTNARRWQALRYTAAALVLGTLFFCLPAPEHQGALIEGVIVDCRAARELSAGAVEHWDKRVVDAHWATPRAGWREDVPRMLREEPAVALTIQVRRQNVIRKHRKPWNSGRVDAQGWREQDYLYEYFADFAGGACENYEGELPVMYMSYGQYGRAWPPDNLSNFLNIPRIEPAPGRLLTLAR